ncbi:MAG TPA: hypothetical protein VLI06_11885 [Solimonas sp.]|nr:hypothetical protein [Solimonas sp.]
MTATSRAGTAGGYRLAAALYVLAGCLAVAQATPPGEAITTQFLVPGTTVDAQASPAVASDAVGNHVVVWESVAGSGWTLRARCYDSTGTARGAEFTIPTGTGMSDRVPAVAMSGGGSFLVAWQRAGLPDPILGSNPLGHRIKARRFNADCSAQTGEFDVSLLPSDSDRHPAVAMSPTGAAVVAWEALSNFNHEVRARRLDPLGMPQGSDLSVDTQGGAQPAVGVNGAGGFVIAWSNQTSIKAQRYAADGSALGGAITVRASTNYETAPAIAVVPDGRFHLAWQRLANAPGQQSAILARSYSAAGAALNSAFVVHSSTARQWQPSIAVDAFGNPGIAWQQSGASSEEIMLKRFDSALGTLGATVAVTTPARYRSVASLASDADGDLVVAWSSLDEDGSGLGIYARRFAGYRAVDTKLTKTSSDPQPRMNSGFRYNLRVDNLTPATTPTGIAVIDSAIGAAARLRITDTLAPALSYSSHDSSDGQWTCQALDQTVTCTRNGSLLPGGSSTVSLNVSAAVEGPLGNTAALSTRSAESALADNSSTVNINVLPPFDTDPDPFSFPAVTGAAPNTDLLSVIWKVLGIDAPAAISISGDPSARYNINGGALTSAPGQVIQGDRVRLRLTSSPIAGQTRTATVKIGNVSSTFSVTTLPVYEFTDVTAAPHNTTVLSNTLRVYGISGSVGISVSGQPSASYNINGGPWTSAPGTVNFDDRVRLRMVSGSGGNETRSMTVTIGASSDIWNVTTAP